MKINCPHCRGQGQVELDTLSEPLRSCYTVMKKLGPATREAIHKASKLNGSVTQTYKRVVRLERLGLVAPQGESRPVVFGVV